MINFANLSQDERLEYLSKGLKKRKSKETRLKIYGMTAIFFALTFLVTLFTSVVSNGYTALQQTELGLEVQLPQEIFNEDGSINPQKSVDYNWDGLLKKALRNTLPEVKGMMDRRLLGDILSANAGYELRQELEADTQETINSITTKSIVWVKASDDVDMLMKGRIDRTIPEKQRRLNDKQIAWVDQLVEKDALRLVFNKSFFTKADSREPESSGILGAIVGSALALIVTVILALPLAVMAAIYLEYFAKPGRITDLIEVNINNLAAVPSIVFGLLGLAVFLGFFGMPRSAPLVGGMVLALMTLPTIIIATRASIRAVPPSIRDAALGIGASPMQTALDHVLPLAAPGILTGTIIGMAQALGETAPLIMIGMVAFIVDVPETLTSPATTLPVQIFIWSDSAERAFYERSSLAIVVLLMFLIFMNLTAVYLRRKLEKKW